VDDETGEPSERDVTASSSQEPGSGRKFNRKTHY
jgi:hypothetical protein